MLPQYIIIRAKPQCFEIYTPGKSRSSFGSWETNKGTLFLTPKYELYSDKNGKLSEHCYSPTDTSVTSISKKYLITGDSLIDITDYSIIWSELSEVFQTSDEKNLDFRP